MLQFFVRLVLFVFVVAIVMFCFAVLTHGGY